MGWVIRPVNEWALILAKAWVPFLLNSSKRQTTDPDRRSRGGCFLASPSCPSEARTGPKAASSRRANCPRGLAATSLFATVAPFACRLLWRSCRPRAPQSGGPGRAAAWPSLFVVDLWAWVVRGRPRNGVGLSPVNAVGHCEQATSPITPSVRRGYPHSPPRERSQIAQCFHRLGSLAPTRSRNVTPPVLSLPGPSVTARCRPALAAYLFARRVRARISGRARTRPGRIRFSFP